MFILWLQKDNKATEGIRDSETFPTTCAGRGGTPGGIVLCAPLCLMQNIILGIIFTYILDNTDIYNSFCLVFMKLTQMWECL